MRSSLMRVKGSLLLLRRLGGGWVNVLRTFWASGLTDLEEMDRWIRRHSSYATYSFDVFDTLLRRRIDPPELTKKLVAEHMSDLLAGSGIHMSPEAILTERDKQEALLNQQAIAADKDPVACLDDIIARTLEALKADILLDRRRVIDYEMYVERTASEPMPGAAGMLARLKAMEKRVIVLSDTYLSVSQMRSVLDHHGLLKYVDRVYVSSTTGRSKAAGGLFRHVAEDESGGIVHVGDNYLSDYVNPRSLGIKALWFHSRSEGRRKKRLRKLLEGNNKLNYLNAIIGVPKRGRSPLFCVGHDVLGPPVTVFVQCLAERLEEDDIQRVFFVARDGFLLKRVYQILQDTGCIDRSLPKPRYLCLSRLPVRAAATRPLTYEHLSEAHRYMVKSGRMSMTFAEIISSYGFDPSELTDIIRRHELDIHAPITELGSDSSLREVIEDGELQARLQVQSERAKALLRDYLLGIGFMGGGKVALVDAHSEGLTQSLMAEAFADEKLYPTVHGYYLCLSNLGIRNTNSGADLSVTSGIISDWRRMSSTQQGLWYLAILVEVFSHPNHGVTTGYKRVNGGVKPVFRSTPQESQYHLTSQGMQGILAYAESYGKYYRLHGCRGEELLEDVRNNFAEWRYFTPHEHVEALKGLFLISDWPQETRHVLGGESSTDSLVTQIKRPVNTIIRRSAVARRVLSKFRHLSTAV